MIEIAEEANLVVHMDRVERYEGRWRRKRRWRFRGFQPNVNVSKVVITGMHQYIRFGTLEATLLASEKLLWYC